MPHFQGTVQGPMSPAHRSGNERSGIKVRADAKAIGIEVKAYHEEESGRDVFAIYLTGGFNYAMPTRLIAAAALSPDGTLEVLGFNVEGKTKERAPALSD